MFAESKVNLKDFIATHTRTIRFWVGLLTTFFSFKGQEVLTFAAYDPSSRLAGDTGSATNFGDLLFKYYPMLQDFFTVAMIISAVICGGKLGLSGATGDARSRQNCIIGLFVIVFAETIVLHAQQLVGIAANQANG